MENVIHRLTLDLTGADTMPRVEVQQDNARSIVICLTQGGRPYWIAEGVTAVFSGRKPDGNPLFNACTIEKNRVRYDFTDQTTNVAGIVECEILLYDAEGKRLASSRFELAIDELIHKDGDVPESAPEVTALTQMVAAGTAMIEDLREALAGLEGVEEILTQARAAAEAAEAAAERAEDALAKMGEGSVDGDLKVKGLTLETRQENDGETGVILTPEGTADKPVVHLYGVQGDEPVTVRGVAPAVLDEDVPNLGQVREMTGNGSGQNLTLDSTLTQSGKAADAKAVGDALDKLEEKIPSIEGLAKEEDIPTKPEDIGAQPKGNYLTTAPVESVNGKTGKVVLSAADVGARPNTWTPTVQEVGADTKGTAEAAVSAHNTNNAAHNDIRLLIEGLTTRLNALANSTDTDLDQMAELVAYIKSNKSLIDAITTSKVSVADIVNNLTTNVANKPLSAAQGVAIKTLIDGLSASLANYQPKGNYALVSAVPTKVSQLQNDAKYLTAVTAAMITAALGYTPINPGLATLARHTDGLLYLFVDGKPVGSGVELPTGGIDGYIDADNNIVVRGLDEGVTYKFYFELADGSLVEGGELVYDNTVYYTVTNTLTNCTNSNSATKAVQGGSYSATITAKSGYELKSVTVTMGGSPVTVSGGTISITNVTGNIVITAVAEEKVVEPSYTNLFDPSKAVLNSRLNSSKDVVTDANATGKIITNFMNIVGKTPFTSDTKVYIKGATFTPDGNTKVLTYKTVSGTDYTASYSLLNGSAVAVTNEGNGVISFSGTSSNIASSFASGVNRMVLVLKVSDSAITAADIQDIVITVDEPIV